MKLLQAINTKNYFELIRFVIVGGLATVVDLVMTTVLVFTTSFHENLITSIAFITAFWVSFFGNIYFTFKAKGSPVAFFALALSTLAIRNLIVYLLVIANIRGFTALIIAMAVVTVITYVVAKFKIFKKS